ncbi:membrane protein [Caballeronia novacaledonica]|uniref:Membrane protein n=1 Tax=Caballeronia novacaledonica TaxID=1544861 RepID=A0A2U3I4W7_9BURK|nr:type VI secretion system lipoprotein TssJ [Caballeronia novacaledonica]SPB15138.1 membrane protein [Caballeronia novacaledonica]
MRLISTVAVLACALWLSACASSSEPTPKEATRLELSVIAQSDVNPDEKGRAAPIVVRIYELKNEVVFNSADFFSLQTQDKTLLANDLVKRDQYQMRPGDSKQIVRRSDPETTTIGVIAAYRDLPNSVWRETFALPPPPDAAWYRFTPKLELTITVGAKAVKIADVANPEKK